MAAGQGFKTFTTGEVLTAGDVNGYLMQGINVFTNATARDAAITAPAEGQFAFTKDNNSLWYYDGAAWVASGATGDIEGVTAGVGISGGGTSGTVTVTNSMATAMTTKGDIVVATGSGTFVRQGVGANNQVLMADSIEADGVKYANEATATLTTTGDTLYASAANTLARRAIGSTGQILTVAGGVPTWATPAAPATNKTFTLLSAAAASGQTYTVSGLSGYDQIMLVCGGLSANGDWSAQIRFNGDNGSTTNYSAFGFEGSGQGGYSAAIMQNINFQDQGNIPLTSSGQAAQNGDVTILISGANSSGVKIVQFACGMGPQVTSYRTNIGMGFYNSSSVISSISLRQNTGSNTWDAGTVRIYGAV